MGEDVLSRVRDVGEETGSGAQVCLCTCALCQAGESRWEVNAVRLGKGVKKWGLMASLSLVESEV